MGSTSNKTPFCQEKKSPGQKRARGGEGELPLLAESLHVAETHAKETTRR